MIKPPPVEEYIIQGQKKGFACSEITSKLKQSGYSNEVISLAESAYHYKRQCFYLTAVLVLLTIILVFVLFLYLDVKTIPAHQVQQSQVLVMPDVRNCIGRMESEKTLCISLIKEELGKHMLTLPSGPERSDLVTQMAAIDNNSSLCDPLGSDQTTACLKGMARLSADLTNNPDACALLKESYNIIPCYMQSLESKDPSAAKSIVNIVRDATSKKNPDICKDLVKEFLVKACVETVNLN